MNSRLDVLDYLTDLLMIQHSIDMNKVLIEAVKAWNNGDEPFHYVCTHGHDACSQIYADETCPYCEKRFHPAMQALIDKWEKNSCR